MSTRRLRRLDRSIASLAWGVGTVALLLGSSCHGPEHGTPDAGQPSADLAVPPLPPADAAVGANPPDMTKAPSSDLALTPSPDMAKAPTADMAKAPAPDMAQPAPRDVTFYVVADTHNDPAPEPRPSTSAPPFARSTPLRRNGQWPTSIGGTATGFVGGKIAPPAASSSPATSPAGAPRPPRSPVPAATYEKGNSSESIDYPAYLGVGNHDIDTADRTDVVANAYRAQLLGLDRRAPQGPERAGAGRQLRRRQPRLLVGHRRRALRPGAPLRRRRRLRAALEPRLLESRPRAATPPTAARSSCSTTTAWTPSAPTASGGTTPTAAPIATR